MLILYPIVKSSVNRCADVSVFYIKIYKNIKSSAYKANYQRIYETPTFTSNVTLNFLVYIFASLR